jgi:uncharacterized membrane protein YphA (DoxX/SURF4 family)
VALLLLRMMVGMTLAFHGVVYFTSWTSPTFKTFAIGTLSIAGGICLVVGLLTPLACTFAILSSIGFLNSWLPLPAPDVLSGNLALVNMIVMAIVIAVLGPGAFSLDSRMFGRREIVIPPTVRAVSTQNQQQKFS